MKAPGTLAGCDSLRSSLHCGAYFVSLGERFAPFMLVAVLFENLLSEQCPPCRENTIVSLSRKTSHVFTHSSGNRR